MTDASTPTEQVPPCRRSWRLVLAIQALNAFNDNFVKMLLVTFAGGGHLFLLTHADESVAAIREFLGAAETAKEGKRAAA